MNREPSQCGRPPRVMSLSSRCSGSELVCLCVSGYLWGWEGWRFFLFVLSLLFLASVRHFVLCFKHEKYHINLIWFDLMNCSTVRKESTAVFVLTYPFFSQQCLETWGKPKSSCTMNSNVPLHLRDMSALNCSTTFQSSIKPKQSKKKRKMELCFYQSHSLNFKLKHFV